MSSAPMPGWDTKAPPTFRKKLGKGAGARQLSAPRGHSLMVKLQPSKLAMRVRFPLPAPCEPRKWVMAALKYRVFVEPVVFALSVALWVGVAPVLQARDPSAAELIENSLPAKTSLRRAAKADLLSAVCAAVRESRKSGPAITTAAAAAQGDHAPDIVASVLRCARRVDCEYVGAIVKAAISAEPGAAASIRDAALGQMPNCEETIRGSTRGVLKNIEGRAKTSSPSSSEPSPSISPSASAEEEFDPREELVLVCDGGTQRAIRKSLLADFLQSHPEANAGSCPPTPTPSPLPSQTPAPPVTRP